MKKLIVAGLCAGLLVAGGCGQQAQNPGKDEAGKQKQMQNINAGIHPSRYQDDPSMLNNRPEWRVLEDPRILEGRVHIENGRAVGTILLDKQVTEKEAHQLAQRYAIEIRDVYTTFPANVHVVQGGRNMFTVELK